MTTEPLILTFVSLKAVSLLLSIEWRANERINNSFYDVLMFSVIVEILFYHLNFYLEDNVWTAVLKTAAVFCDNLAIVHSISLNRKKCRPATMMARGNAV